MSSSAAIRYYGKLKFRRLVFRSGAALHTVQPPARWASAELETQTKDSPDMDSWPSVPQAFRALTYPLPAPWEELCGPLRHSRVDDLVVVGQIGQSLDGRVATETGHSHYINGPAGLAHLHRLRALVDAVVIGVGTALADDPQLTVRRVAGPQPARVVIDARGRLSAGAKMLAKDGVRRLVLTSAGAKPPLPSDIEIVGISKTDGQIAPAAILAALAERGLRRVLIEGGADTVSRFLAAKCLDRLHIIVAPIILGSGRASFSLPPIARVDEALLMPVSVHRLDDEVLFDCDLSAQRVPVGRAKKST
jgi:diaminohydroxyphosphoribosylaminopyrimidine deaminase / 5-amino-6-(5-phosphoribosylamino)uracil reductase